MIVRREASADITAVRVIHAAAFGGDGGEPVEARLLDELRACDGWLPRLSLVVELGRTVVGHAVCTRGRVGPVAALGLGPIAVAPACQGSGIGTALMHAMIGVADGLDEPLIALLGSPDFYGRFGFVRSTDVGIDPPDPAWGVHFQVRTLSTHDPSMRGTFRYAAPFERL